MRTHLSLDRVANLAVIAAAATFIVLSVRGYFGWNPSPSENKVSSVLNASPVEPVQDVTVDIAQAAKRSTGRPMVAFVEFADFQCPYCARYAKGTYTQIQRDFIDTGEVEYAFFNFPLEDLHPLAMRASQVADCVDQQGRFWDLHDRLFGIQDSLSEGRMLQEAHALTRKSAGLDQCLNGPVPSRILSQIAVAKKVGVDSTPTFLIGRLDSPDTVRVVYRIRGTSPYATFAKVLKELVTSAKTATS